MEKRWLKMVLVFIFALGSSAIGGFVSYKLIEKSLQNHENKPIDLSSKGVILLEPFVVNLADTEASRYLRIKISLLVDRKETEEFTENQALQMKIRDVILQNLTAKTSHEIINEDGKNKLRHEIQEKVALYFHTLKLVDVMFTEFVIQL